MGLWNDSPTIPTAAYSYLPHWKGRWRPHAMLIGFPSRPLIKSIRLWPFSSLNSVFYVFLSLNPSTPPTLPSSGIIYYSPLLYSILFRIFFCSFLITSGLKRLCFMFFCSFFFWVWFNLDLCVGIYLEKFWWIVESPAISLFY